MKPPFSADHPFRNLVSSNYLESIFYADLFRINNRTWMIQGYGKTCAARIASFDIDEARIATDGVAIIREGNILYGRYDIGATNRKTSDLYALHKIDAIAYCLNESETMKAFEPRNGARDIVDVGSEVLSMLCASYPYPAHFAQYFCSKEAYVELCNPLRITKRFQDLSDGVIGTKFLLVPYMPTVEEKGALYSDFVF